jgi:hypothetical protein
VQIRSLTQAAKELGVSRVTVYELVRAGNIETVFNPNHAGSKGLTPTAFALLKRRLFGPLPTTGPAGPVAVR